ncbi:HD domain-containing protein [Dongia sedimenti]|uniref:HD domain-containing protein n=1 Tax=Dongia sedimenti TaxID=3064282 RepID=A0ABU0YUB5_9PROT|nr:HD domain-containing protein [Rhodospirillaceae bacterium R-7]
MNLPFAEPVRDRDGFVASLFAWLSQRGATHYDPSVTQLEHALQAAHLAEAEGASEAEIIAALLHDVGHLLANEHRNRERFLGHDFRHERIGADWLEPLFGPAVAGPIRHHVAAKRYLCATDSGYWQGLSSASQHSLEMQGGPMTSEEVIGFETLPDAAAAVTLRRRDDRAKCAGLAIPSLRHYTDLLRDHLRIEALAAQ